MSTAAPASTADLINYIKARLGDDVINIEITTDQYDIIVEDSLTRFYNKVYDGYEETYFEITMPTSGIYTLDNDILSVAYVMGAMDYVQRSLILAAEDVSNIIGNRNYTFEFSRMTHVLKVFQTLQVDTKMGIRAYKKFDATTYTDIYNHPWLKKYAVALARLQWGDNISKYGSVILPGGMTLNSDVILERGRAEVEQCELDLLEEYMFKPLPQMH